MPTSLKGYENVEFVDFVKRGPYKIDTKSHFMWFMTMAEKRAQQLKEMHGVGPNEQAGTHV